MIQRKIIHIDMDAFYASVEQRDNPQLKGRAIAVGHPGRRGVVATASYEARRYGIHSAMPSTTALRLCPSLIFVEPRFDVYKQVSTQINAIFHDYTDLVEPLSLDEAFLDVTENKKEISSAIFIAREIKQRILTETGLTASAGVSINKFLAKIASDYQKPNGLFTILPKQAEEFIEALDIECFYGVGKVTAQRMHQIGIHKGADLKQFTEIQLTEYFGKIGSLFYQFARAIDNRPVVPDRIRKSVGTENTFHDDIADKTTLIEELRKIQLDLFQRIDKRSFFGRTLTLKIKFDDFQQITRSRTTPLPLDTLASITTLSEQLFDEVNLNGKGVRLMGLTIGNAEYENEQAIQLRIPFEKEQ